jgi:hypothetical protein
LIDSYSLYKDEVRLLDRYTDCCTIFDAGRKKQVCLDRGSYNYDSLQFANLSRIREEWYATTAKAAMGNSGWIEWNGKWYGPNRAQVGGKYKKRMS